MRHCFFINNPLCIIALGIKLDYNYLELLNLGICKTLETKSWRLTVVSKVVHLIREDDHWTPTNENTWVPRIPGQGSQTWVNWKCGKVDIRNSKTPMIWKLAFKWYVIRCGCEVGHHKDMCFKVIELWSQNILTILRQEFAPRQWRHSS